jgi:hypothetical protein
VTWHVSIGRLASTQREFHFSFSFFTHPFQFIFYYSTTSKKITETVFLLSRVFWLAESAIWFLACCMHTQERYEMNSDLVCCWS